MSKKTIIEPRILKGTRDFLPLDMAKRDFVMNKIQNVFKRFGYDRIETPILSPADTILGKYGEEGDRLTYHFEDNGGREIALPYDLTVPFARLFAAHFSELPVPFKRYQIQRVWRAEKPQKGRLREFYQCDIDVIGTKSLVADSEIAKVIATVFEELGFDTYELYVNSRRLMNAILESLQFEHNPSAVIRAIDKMDKIGEDGVRAELEKLGIESGKIKKLFACFQSGDFSAYDTSEIDTFMNHCKALGMNMDHLHFSPTLARGLDYYTGMIFEVIVPETGLGSMCGGGRYDDLCGLFCKEDFSGVGVAFGFERIMIALEEMGKLGEIALNSKVLITVFDDESTEQSLNLYDQLTAAGVPSEIYFEAAKLGKQFKYADRKGIPLVVVCGPDERKRSQVTVKTMASGEEETVPFSELPKLVQNKF